MAGEAALQTIDETLHFSQFTPAMMNKERIEDGERSPFPSLPSSSRIIDKPRMGGLAISGTFTNCSMLIVSPKDCSAYLSS